MIIVQLLGGLGNQMFQYAAARRISLVNKRPLKLDIGAFTTQSLITSRKYELDILNIKAEFASPEEINKLREYRPDEKPRLLRRLKRKLIPYYRRSHVRERHFHFDPDILKLKGNVYLEGFWQSEKYFKDIDDIIRKEFTINNDPDPVNKKMAAKIATSESVSIHIRRGDYASDKSTNQYHGMCSPEYYYSGIKVIAGKIRNPRFFVFSDEPEWVKENLDIGVPAIYMDFNGPEKAYEDLRLMSLCKHHIIANSSFSWWGAWLCQNQAKTVIAPSKWFNDFSINTKDLIPDGWLKI